MPEPVITLTPCGKKCWALTITFNGITVGPGTAPTKEQALAKAKRIAEELKQPPS